MSPRARCIQVCNVDRPGPEDRAVADARRLLGERGVIRSDNYAVGCAQRVWSHRLCQLVDIGLRVDPLEDHLLKDALLHDARARDDDWNVRRNGRYGVLKGAHSHRVRRPVAEPDDAARDGEEWNHHQGGVALVVRAFRVASYGIVRVQFEKELALGGIHDVARNALDEAVAKRLDVQRGKKHAFCCITHDCVFFAKHS